MNEFLVAGFMHAMHEKLAGSREQLLAKMKKGLSKAKGSLAARLAQSRASKGAVATPSKSGHYERMKRSLGFK